MEELALSKIQTKITSFLQKSYPLTEKGMQEANKNFTEIILQAAKCSLKIVSRTKTKRPMNIKKRWFNKECDTAQKLMRNMSNIKHRNPNDQSIRDAYYQSTKNFQNICKQQKNIFWNKKIQDLEENCIKNCKY